MNVLKRMSALLCALSVGMSGCAERPDTSPKSDAASQADVQVAAVQTNIEKAVPPERDKISKVTLLAVGDNLIHDVIYKQAQARTKDKSYDFKPVYERVKKQIAAADIAMINQETPIVKDRAPSSYPLFNTPPEMTENLRDIGFDVLSISNNHMIDQGVDGLAATAALIRATKGLTVTGVYETPEQRDETVVVEKNGIKFAFLGFTQYTNGLVFPKGREYMAVYTDDAAEMRRQIERARQKADVVVVSVHWGNEDTGVPTDNQRQVARNLADYGADMIIGTHPHVLQPVEIVENAQGKKVPVIYSLGNFVSTQSKSANMIGAMAEITVEKNQTSGKVTVGRPEITPTITHYGAGMWNVSIYPLSEYTEKLAESHGVRLSHGKTFSRAFIDATIAGVIAPEYIASNVRGAIAAAASSDAAKETTKPSAGSSSAPAPLGSPENPYAIEPVDPGNASSGAGDKTKSSETPREVKPDTPGQSASSKPASSKKSASSSKAPSASSEEGRLLPRRSDNAA